MRPRICCGFRFVWHIISGKSGTPRDCSGNRVVGLLWAGLLARDDRNAVEMAAAHRRSFQCDNAAALEGAVENGFGEIRIVQHVAPLLERLVGGEDHRSGWLVAPADDMEENVGGIGAVGEIARFVHKC